MSKSISRRKKDNDFFYPWCYNCITALAENASGVVAVSNRIFETRLYNLFLSEEILHSAIYKAADGEKNLFVRNGVHI